MLPYSGTPQPAPQGSTAAGLDIAALQARLDSAVLPPQTPKSIVVVGWTGPLGDLMVREGMREGGAGWLAGCRTTGALLEGSFPALFHCPHACEPSPCTSHLRVALCSRQAGLFGFAARSSELFVVTQRRLLTSFPAASLVQAGLCDFAAPGSEVFVVSPHRPSDLPGEDNHWEAEGRSLRWIEGSILQVRGEAHRGGASRGGGACKRKVPWCLLSPLVCPYSRPFVPCVLHR